MPSSHAGKFMPKGTKDLYGEVERLVKQCEEVLTRAYGRLQPTESGSIANDYHHAFAIENSYLEEVKRKLHKLIPPAIETMRNEK